MVKRSKHQAKVIRNYYQNRGPIAVQRLQELVTDLYLSEGKKRARHWKSVATHLAALGIKQPRIDQLIQQDKPELIADLLKDFNQER
ncbi:MAG: hypothetical protein ACC628_06095 [Pirellulaceae bacterium]